MAKSAQLKTVAKPAAAVPGNGTASGEAKAPGASGGVVEPRPVGSTTEADNTIGLDDLARRFASKRNAAEAAPVEGKPAGAAEATPAAATEAEQGTEVAAEVEGQERDELSEVAEQPTTAQGDEAAEAAELPDLNADAGSEAAAGEGEAAGQDNEVVEGLPAKVQEAINRRIGKLVARTKEAEERARAAEAKVQELGARSEEPGARSPAAGGNPAGNLQTERELADMEEQMRNLRRWCRRNADGGVVPGKDGDREYSAEDVARMEEQAEDWLERHIPAQRQLLEKRRSYAEQTRQIFPWMGKAGSVGRREAEGILAYVPELRGRPDAEWLAALAVLGVREYNRQQQAAKATKLKAAGKAQVAGVVVPRVGRAPAPKGHATEQESALKAADTRFQETGSVDDLALRFAAKRKARELVKV